MKNIFKILTIILTILITSCSFESSYLEIISVSPEAGTEISEGDSIEIYLKYNITDFDIEKTYRIVVTLRFTDDKWPYIGTLLNNESNTLTTKTGIIPVSATFEPEENASYLEPYTIELSLEEDNYDGSYSVLYKDSKAITYY